MQASSLVFVAIVVGWLVYLLPQWVRRRDALGAARGRDRHSAGLRVLSRRHRTAPGRSSIPLLTQHHGAPLGATLVVDDADDHENGLVYVPGARRAAPRPAPRAEAPRTEAPRTETPRTEAPRAGVERAAPAATTPSRSAPAPAAPTQRPATGEPATPAPSRVAARRRAAVLVLLALGAVTGWAGVLLGTSAVPAAVVSALLLLYVGALRSAARGRDRRREAQAERLRREADRAARAAQAATRAAAAARAARESAAAAAGAHDDTVVLNPLRDDMDLAVPGPVTADGTWVPIPVPPPTYTLKPMAPRPGHALIEARRAQEAAALAAAERAEQEAAAERAEAERADAERQGRPDAARRGPAARGAGRVLAHPVDLDEVLARRRAVND